MQNGTQHFRIRYDIPSRMVLTALGSGRRVSGVEVDRDTVRVRMGWAFATSIARSDIESLVADASLPDAGHWRGTSGVHGRRGQWLVNGAGDGLVSLTINPVSKARVCGLPVRLRRLTVSVEDPQGLSAALAKGGPPNPGKAIA